MHVWGGDMLLPLHTICEEMPCHARDGQQGVVHPRLLRPRTGPENWPRELAPRTAPRTGWPESWASMVSPTWPWSAPPNAKFPFRHLRFVNHARRMIGSARIRPPPRPPRTGPVRPRVWAGPFSILQLRACVAPRAPYPTRGPTLSPAPAPAHRSLKVAARMRPSWRHWVLAPVGYCALESRVGTMRCTLILERSMSSPTFGPITFFQ